MKLSILMWILGWLVQFAGFFESEEKNFYQENINGSFCSISFCCSDIMLLCEDCLWSIRWIRISSCKLFKGLKVLLNLKGFFLKVYQKVKNHTQNWKKFLKKWLYHKRYFKFSQVWFMQNLRVNTSNIIEAREEYYI